MGSLLSHSKKVPIEIRARRPRVNVQFGDVKVTVTITPTAGKFDLPGSVQSGFKIEIEAAAQRLAKAIEAKILEEIAKGGNADFARRLKTYPYNVVERRHEGFVVRIEAEVRCKLLEVPQDLFVGALRPLQDLPTDLKLWICKRPPRR